MVPYLSAFCGDAGASAVCKEFHAACFQEAQSREMAPVEEEEGEDLCNCEFSLAYGGKILLNNARLHLKRGQRYGLCGPNGAGKSTLMRVSSATNPLVAGLGGAAPVCPCQLAALRPVQLTWFCRAMLGSACCACGLLPPSSASLLTFLSALARCLWQAIANGQLDGFPPKSELRTVYVEHDIDASGELPAAPELAASFLSAHFSSGSLGLSDQSLVALFTCVRLLSVADVVAWPPSCYSQRRRPPWLSLW